jgi:hypothetical protein
MPIRLSALSDAQFLKELALKVKPGEVLFSLENEYIEGYWVDHIFGFKCLGVHIPLPDFQPFGVYSGVILSGQDHEGKFTFVPLLHNTKSPIPRLMTQARKFNISLKGL